MTPTEESWAPESGSGFDPGRVLLFPHWSVWQHSETGRVPGLTGNVGLNLFNGNAQNFADWAAGVQPKP